MSGFPQLRESARLYRSGDRMVPVVVVRLEQRMDGSGRWDLYVNDPPDKQQPEHFEFADKTSARAGLEQVYAWGAVDGEWDISRPEPY